MPHNKDLKRLVRARMAETGENYTQALTALLGETPLGSLPDGWFTGSRCPEYAAGLLPPVQAYGGDRVLRLRLRADGRPGGFGTIMRSIDAAPYRGRRVRFSATLRGRGITGRAGVWLRADTAEGDSSAFDNMDDRPLRGSTGWTQAANVLDVAEDATLVNFGVLLTGAGAVDLARPRFEVVDTDVPVTRLWRRPPAVGPQGLDVGVDATGTHGEADELRGIMVDQLVARYGLSLELGRELPESVLAALRRVPRHLFTPGEPLSRAYEADTSVITKVSKRGASLSSVTAPWVVAYMLTQLDVRPGQSVLEIGSGGYQAALLRELVGPGGSVTTLDIDPEVTARARACLDAAGYRDVRTLCADGESGAPGYGPFDRIIVAVQAWDIPPAWTQQLADDGRLVVPLLTRGLSRTWELDREDGHLASRSNLMRGFVPMQGAGKHRHWSVPVDQAGVRLWGEDPVSLDAGELAGVMAGERSEAWAGVTRQRGESFADQDLWLITVPDLCWLTASQDAIDRGLIAPTWKVRTPALAGGGSLAYRARPRPVDDEGTVFEFGAYGHGPRGAELAERLAEQIQVLDREHRDGPGPVLTVYPVGTPARDLPPWAGLPQAPHDDGAVLARGGPVNVSYAAR